MILDHSLPMSREGAGITGTPRTVDGLKLKKFMSDRLIRVSLRLSCMRYLRDLVRWKRCCFRLIRLRVYRGGLPF